MRLCVVFWPFLVMTALSAGAQTPGPRPARADDAAALEEAIRAVDRAKAQAADPVRPASGGQAAGAAVKPAAVPGGRPAPGAVQEPKTAGESEAVPRPKPAVASTQTQISGLEDAVIDNVNHTITFRNNVLVDRPDLKIWCHQLEILLNRKPAKAVPSSPASREAEDGDALGAETIKTATATSTEGGFVVVWRKTESGDVVAIGRQAVYTAADGMFTITGMPEVLRDMNLHLYSPGEADKLTLFKNGNARGSKKSNFNLSAVRAKEIRQRMFSHVPGRRPAEAVPAAAESSPVPADALPPPPAVAPRRSN